MVMVYYHAQIQIKMSKFKRHIGPSTEETRHMLPVVLSQWNHQEWYLFLPEMMCNNASTVLPTREAHPNLGDKGFFGAESCKHVTHLCQSTSSPSEAKLIQCSSKTPP